MTEPSLQSRIFRQIVRVGAAPLLNHRLPVRLQRWPTDLLLRVAILPENTRVETVSGEHWSAELVRVGQTVGELAQGCVLYFHGGAYNIGSPRGHRNVVAHLSEACGLPVLSVDYRLAPEHPYPAALQDAEAAWQFLLSQGVPANKIVVAGDSAGGGLSLALVLRLRQNKQALPGGIGLFSPWVDLSLSQPSYKSHARQDPMLNRQWLWRMAKNYAGKHLLSEPGISPLFADYRDMPPLYIQVGEHEMLLDDARNLARKAKQSGVSVELQVWPNMWHVWQFEAGLMPEASRAVECMAGFVRNRVRRDAA
ncbi:MAG: alpha/beta hydrolase [Hahellaceae bacterium]|nr:alpha/beta hydrolase [Hahellaceae bacterium]